MAVTLWHDLDRDEVERRLRSCWSAQQRAELVGDDKSAEAMRDTIDELLDHLLRLIPRQR